MEYETYREARDAITGLNNSNILGKTVEVDWAFVKPPPPGRYRRYVRVLQSAVRICGVPQSKTTKLSMAKLSVSLLCQVVMYTVEPPIRGPLR